MRSARTRSQYEVGAPNRRVSVCALRPDAGGNQNRGRRSEVKELLARILCSAGHSMWEKDPTLGRYTSETEQHELNLAFHYASELRAWFPGFDCDFDVSKVSCNYERPDIIIHRRNTHALNFLVIEIKREKSRKLVPVDLRQIRERWFKNYFQYRFGAAVILEDDKPQFEVQVLKCVKRRKPVIADI